jgi:NAD(P)H-hydrate repair Nnr-like enzyme with NAD(P)H-hydrate epimerase domain
MVQLKQLMIEECGISGEQILEIIGQHIAQFSSRMLQGEVGRKLICILLTNGDAGESALIAAKKLINDGAEICMISIDSWLSGNADWESEPGKICNLSAISDQDLLETLKNTNWDLLINTLTGENILRSYSDRDIHLIEIINEMTYPVLSIDIPADLTRGINKRPAFSIRSTATLSFGLPLKELILSGYRSQVGELYLADLEIPAALLKKIGLSLGSAFEQNKIINISSGSSSCNRDMFSEILFEKELLGSGKGCLLLEK